MEKKEVIDRIKTLIGEHGELTTQDLNLGTSPIHFQLGSMDILVERFNQENATLITYLRGDEVDENDLPYEDLDDDVLYEILTVLENYDTDADKTYKRAGLYD